MPRRILLIDDDASIRQTLHIALTKAGYEVVDAKDGQEAMRIWRDQGMDLVITDLYMPDKNGLEVIMELRALSPSTPVIAMTHGGRGKQMDILGDAKLLGAVRAIAKPFRLEEIVAVVDEELGKGK